jgi:hypothetical protein
MDIIPWKNGLAVAKFLGKNQNAKHNPIDNRGLATASKPLFILENDIIKLEY